MIYQCTTFFMHIIHVYFFFKCLTQTYVAIWKKRRSQLSFMSTETMPHCNYDFHIDAVGFHTGPTCQDLGMCILYYIFVFYLSLDDLALNIVDIENNPIHSLYNGIEIY